jgi:ADP-heptose:LPS heptosyltransferase
LRPGGKVHGRRILVVAEQGLGDAIMAASHIPILAQQGARVALACNPTLRPFFAHIPGIEALLSPPPDMRWFEELLRVLLLIICRSRSPRLLLG